MSERELSKGGKERKEKAEKEAVAIVDYAAATSVPRLNGVREAAELAEKRLRKVRLTEASGAADEQK